MTKLNLTATGTDQEILLTHLTPLISDALAEKINNGVKITKDGKELLNKKDLDTFMEYLIDEIDKMEIAKKYKRANVAGMEGADILKHAIHYFEEDSIEGKLFNADGTAYEQPKPAKPYSAVKVVPTTQTPTPQPKPQLSIFDMVNDSAESAKPETVEQPDNNATNAENEQPTPEELEEIYTNEQEQIPEPVIEQATVKHYYQCYLNIQEVYKDSIIAYRLGDFFEIFGENAKLIADELNMKLTGRDVGLKERVPMIGIPFHRMDEYITKITNKSHKIAVVEPQGEIQTFEPMKQPEQKATFNSFVQPEDDTLRHEREIAKAFDQNALIILSDILGDIFIME